MGQQWPYQPTEAKKYKAHPTNVLLLLELLASEIPKTLRLAELLVTWDHVEMQTLIADLEQVEPKAQNFLQAP